ncbi:hypothetical protein WJT86_10120 [Microvirga sp. W0021]|uniref:DNA transfer protein n=1 Tax=Hohaiivirga grylli TaxID=3133970 RepID=A0ABV0BMA5_9HYPH
MASIFSGKGGRQASMEENKQLMTGLKGAGEALELGKNIAANYLNKNQGIYENAYNNAQGLLDSAYGSAQSQLKGAADTYNPFYNTGMQANTAYANAMGLNGAEGYAQAMQDFRTGPGYQFMMDQGVDALNRSAAARGSLASGNNTVDILKYAQGTADQTYSNYLSNLNNMTNTGMQAANGIANANQGLASLAMNYGNQGAQLAQGLGDRLGGLNSALANNELGFSQQLAQNTLNVSDKMAENTGQGYMAGQQAASNRFGAIMGGIQTGASILGAMML